MRLKDHREWAVHIIFALAACGLVTLPLVGLPGYEFSAALAIMYGVVGTVFTAYAPHRQPVFVVARHTATFTLSMLPALLLATLRATPCNPFAAIGFFPLLAVISAFVASSAGAFIASISTRWWKRLLLALGLILVSAVSTVWPILFGPQVFAFNHFGGYFPGPLYDETLRITPALLWFRVGSVALGLLFAGLAARLPRLWAPAALVFFGIEFNGTALGFRMSDDELALRLGGLRETEHFVFHHPRGMTEPDRFARDLEFRHSQISKFLGGSPPGKVTVWLYRSAAEKQQLVGAEHTQFSKPWRREVHVNDTSFPHPVIKHELMHAMAAPFGSAPFGVTATIFGLSPYVGLIEGLAVAGDNPVDDLTLHEWAAAMKKQHLLPDLRVLLEPSGFYSAPASRAYTSAGSFLRWLGETHGGDKLLALYRRGDFVGVYGRPLADLVTDYEAFLEHVPLDPAAVNQAFARFKQGSVFERPCAREVATLTADAASTARDDPARALEDYERCHSIQPQEPAHELARAEMLRRLGRVDEAKAGLEALAERVKDAPTSWADAALALADLALLRGDVVTAQALLQRIVASHVSPAVDRAANVRLSAMALPAPGAEAVRRFLTASAETTGLGAYLLRDALDASPHDATLTYLLGRRLAQSDAPVEALRYLDEALGAPQAETLRRETLRLAIEMAWRADRCDRVRALALEAKALNTAFGARADDWVQRCDFK